MKTPSFTAGIILSAVILVGSPNAFCDGLTPTQVSKEHVMRIPANNLAHGYRWITDLLPMIELARKGVNIQINEAGQPVTINKGNVEVWLSGLRQRQHVYAEGIEARGYSNVAGQYSFRASDACGKLPEGQTSISQDGFTLNFKIGDAVAIGTVVEQNVVVNIGGTIGEVPYFFGEIKKGGGEALELTEPKSECTLSLTK